MADKIDETRSVNFGFDKIKIQCEVKESPHVRDDARSTNDDNRSYWSCERVIITLREYLPNYGHTANYNASGLKSSTLYFSGGVGYHQTDLEGHDVLTIELDGNDPAPTDSKKDAKKKDPEWQLGDCR